MVLAEPDKLLNVATDGVVRLSESSLTDVNQLYQEAYPEVAFDPRMLATNQFFGFYQAAKLVAVAGVHIYSADYQVAAIGNITVHPSCRGQGLCRKVTARLCQSLWETTTTIGLNVMTTNLAAIQCYTRLGFQWVGNYGEWVAVRKT